jgi:isopenicillin-N epimerase
VNLSDLGADIYTGACHKWLCAPKGVAFLYASHQVQSWLEPLVVSWGYECLNPSASQFIDLHQWQGTRDLAAFLSVPAAIEFQDRHQWDSVRLVCCDLARRTRRRLNELTGLEPICPEPEDEQTPNNHWYHQMFTARLPQETDLDELKKRLYEKYRIEVPVILWNDQKFIRVSFQGYNSPSDAEALLGALAALLPIQPKGGKDFFCVP